MKWPVFQRSSTSAVFRGVRWCFSRQREEQKAFQPHGRGAEGSGGVEEIRKRYDAEIQLKRSVHIFLYDMCGLHRPVSLKWLTYADTTPPIECQWE